jgi:hypothetical protein
MVLHPQVETVLHPQVGTMFHHEVEMMLHPQLGTMLLYIHNSKCRDGVASLGGDCVAT